MTSSHRRCLEVSHVEATSASAINGLPPCPCFFARQTSQLHNANDNASNINLFRGANFQHAFATIAETPTASMYLVQTEVNVSPTPYNLTSWAVPQLLQSVSTLCIQGGLTQSHHANDAWAAICVAPLVAMGVAYLKDGKAVFVLCASPPAL